MHNNNGLNNDQGCIKYQISTWHIYFTNEKLTVNIIQHAFYQNAIN